MDQNSLVSEEIEAGAELLRRFDQFMPIKAAFWLRASDEELTYLYIASDQINDQNFDVAYREVLRIVQEMNPLYDFDPFSVRVIYGDNPMTLAAVQFQQKYPTPLNTRFRGYNFGGKSVDYVYLYALQNLHSGS